MQPPEQATLTPHAGAALAEADRQMVICNACRYCEGLCAVFPAMELRRHFPDGDLNYLANLCHNCGACLDACQFAPPHGFAVDVPRALAEVREDSYRHYAWPAALRGAFDRNGVAIAIAAALSVAGFLIGFAVANDADALFGAHSGPGAFYRLMPHTAMAILFGAAFLYAIVAMALSVRAFRRDIGTSPSGGRPLLQATLDAARLRYLDGGGAGCAPDESRGPDRRRLFHHLTFYGFLLCLLSTTVATLYHYLLGREAPYAWYDIPVILGTLGGVGLLIGPAGLLTERRHARPDTDPRRSGMATAFLLMLWLTGATGLALLVLRETQAMGVLLALHLGVVFALFITMPYGKFVHGLYRFAALLHSAQERQASLNGDAAK